MEARVTWRHENMKIYFPTNKSIYLVIQKCTFFLPIKLNVTLTQHQLLKDSQRRKTSRNFILIGFQNLHGASNRNCITNVRPVLTCYLIFKKCVLSHQTFLIQSIFKLIQSFKNTIWVKT